MSRNLSKGCWWEDRLVVLLAADSSRRFADFFPLRVCPVELEAANLLDRCLLLRLIGINTPFALSYPRFLHFIFISIRQITIDFTLFPYICLKCASNDSIASIETTLLFVYVAGSRLPRPPLTAVPLQSNPIQKASGQLRYDLRCLRK